jgi:hypothetical protein
MQFMLLINGDETWLHDLPDAGTGAGPISPEFVAYTEAMKKAGVWRGGDRLQTTHYGARVRVRDGKSVVLDGPYADAKEQLGGYYVIDVPTIDEAIEWAVRNPASKFGTIDVRPLAIVPR